MHTYNGWVCSSMSDWTSRKTDLDIKFLSSVHNAELGVMVFVVVYTVVSSEKKVDVYIIHHEQQNLRYCQ